MINSRVVLFENEIPPMKLREGDEAEVRALNLSAEHALKLSWAKSTVCFAVYFHETLGAMWGLRRTGTTADVWLLTTEEVSMYPVSFHGESLRLVNALLEQFEILRCEVHIEYEKARRWLRRLGFAEMGECNHLGFLTMERRR
jgi:hypothetical protein